MSSIQEQVDLAYANNRLGYIEALKEILALPELQEEPVGYKTYSEDVVRNTLRARIRAAIERMK